MLSTVLSIPDSSRLYSVKSFALKDAQPTGTSVLKYLRLHLSVVVLSALIFTIPLKTQAADATEPDIVQIKGGLHRFTHNDRAGVFLVTEQGIILGDPLSTETAQWLQDAMATQFNLPVKYVFYSHLSPERAAGAQVFVDTGAVVVAHQNSVDHSNPEVASANVVFADHLTLYLGAERVELHYFGHSLTDDMIVAHFPQQEAVFAADFVSVERLPDHDISLGKFPEWFTAIDKMNRIDFTYFLPGTGNIGIKNDGVEHGYFLRDLHNQVRRATAAGVTLEDMIQTLKLDRYQRWANFKPQLSNVITGMYKALNQSK